VSEVSGQERLARAALTYVAEPGDPVMGALLGMCTPAEIVTALVQGRMPVAAAGPTGAGGPDQGCLPGLAGDGRPGPGRDGLPGLERALGRWAGRLGEAPAEPALDAWRRQGIRLICPGDPEWPGQLDVLGNARPWGLWVRGRGDLRYACLRSVSIVGTRAVTAYGSHVCTEMAATLAEHGWTVVSGGAKATKTQLRATQTSTLPIACQ
jgi:DNA processing protein